MTRSRPLALTALTALMALTACGSGQASTSQSAPETPAASQTAATPAVPVTQNVPAVPDQNPVQAPAGSGYNFAFWFNGDDIGLSYPEYESHPCGVVHRMAVSRIPSFENDRDHDIDTAAEFDATGNIVRKWAIPVDETIVGVEGENLLIAHDGELLGIGPNGDIVKVAGTLDDSNLTEHACADAAKKLFAPSVYLACSATKDMTSGKERYLAFDGPCT